VLNTSATLSDLDSEGITPSPSGSINVVPRRRDNSAIMLVMLNKLLTWSLSREAVNVS